MTGLYQHVPELNFELRIIFNCVFFFLRRPFVMSPCCQSLAAKFTLLFQTAKQSFMKTLNGNLKVFNLPHGGTWVTSQRPRQDV